jgi:integrase
MQPKADRRKENMKELELVANARKPSLDDLIHQFMDKKRREGMDVFEIQNMENYLRDRLRCRGANTVTLVDIRNYCQVPGLSPRYKRSRTRIMTEFARFVIGNGNQGRNGSSGTIEEHVRRILFAGEARRMLVKGERFALRPYVSLGLFAASQPDELMELDWSDVDDRNRVVHAPDRLYGYSLRGLVRFNDALAAWLPKPLPDRGPIVDDRGFEENWAALLRAAKIAPCPTDVLADTCIAYHLAAYGNLQETNKAFGYFDEDLYQYYRQGRVDRNEARKFWALRPDSR